MISSENKLLQLLLRVSKLLSEFSIYHFFDSLAHHFSCRPQIYPPLLRSVQAKNSPAFTTFGNQVRELLPSVRMRGQYLLVADCAEHLLWPFHFIFHYSSLLLKILYSIENIYYFLCVQWNIKGIYL